MLKVLNARWHSSAHTQGSSGLIARPILRSSVPFSLQVFPCQAIEFNALCSGFQSPAYMLVMLSETQLGKLTFLCWFLIRLDSFGNIDMNVSGIVDSEEVLLEYGLEDAINLEEGI